MEQLFYDEKNLFAVKNKNNDYYFEYHPALKDGSLVIYIIKKYGITKLKEILNYHKFMNKENLLNHFVDNYSLTSYFEKCTNLYSDFKQEFCYIYSSQHKYNPVLEYFILNENNENVDLILDEIFINKLRENDGIQVDFLNLKIIFSSSKNIQYQDSYICNAISSTVIKILLENDNLSENALNNCIKALNLIDHYIDSQYIRFFIILLHYKKNNQYIINNYIRNKMQLSNFDFTWSQIILKSFG